MRLFLLPNTLVQYPVLALEWFDWETAKFRLLDQDQREKYIC